MKIGFFTDTYLPNVDGVVRAIVNFRGELEKHGHDVFVFTSGTRDDARSNADEKVFFHAGVRFPAYPQYKLAVFPYYKAMTRAKRAGVELVHSHGLLGMGMAAISTAKALRLPLVGTFHTLAPRAIQNFFKKKWGKYAVEAIAWRAVRLYYKPFDLVMAPSKVIAGVLEENGVPNCVVVPNGIDVSKFAPNLDRKWARTPLHVLSKEKIVLVAGRLSKEKNVDVVVKAFDRVLREQHVHLVVSGEGPAKAEVQALVEKRGLQTHVSFLGFLPEQELPLYYAAADVFATASTFETQGLTVLESMACGTPVVAANSMALPETVRDGYNGFLFEPFDEEELAEKIIKALSLKPNEKRRLRANARKTAEMFSVPKTTDALLKAYEKVK